MADRAQILGDLTRAANDARAVAVLWHLAITAALLTLLWGWRPSNRQAGVMLAAPIASVSVVAWAFGSPFNGVVFAALAVSLVALSLAHVPHPPTPPSHAAHVAGAIMIAFGWTYPRFVVVASPNEYLVAAPLGLLPCPTLALVVGFAIAAQGLGNRAWSWTLAAAAVFYALYGSIALGVTLDALLLLGAAALVVVTQGRRAPARRVAQ
ncbi:MAG TPA: hypothetical protein VLM85_15520 [Polyangiaceae bacterium]|nr:hypothetical protein [Polyangiaceae bacterium]